MKQDTWRKLIIATLVAICFLSISLKVFYWGFNPTSVIPVKTWDLTLNMTMESSGKDLTIESFLPQSNEKLTIYKEDFLSEDFVHEIQIEDKNRKVKYLADNAQGKVSVSYHVELLNRNEIFKLPKFIDKNTSTTQNSPHLAPTEMIQSQDPAIIQLVHSKGWDTLTNVLDITHAVYQYTSDSIAHTEFSGETDAILTLKLGEASCNGKSRLAVAILRQLQIPAKLIGGIILKTGAKKTIHQWIEVWIGNQWVPICPLNRHYLEIPSTYLKLYEGDQGFFTRTAHANFNYEFVIQKKNHLRPDENLEGMPAWINLRSYFTANDVSVSTIALLLMIPFGALVTVIFKNMIGLATFGTFLPVLIAASYQDMGLVWGHLGFVSIILIGAVLRVGLDRLKLLHTPKLTAILVLVISMILLAVIFGIEQNIDSLIHGQLYPIAILAITIERFGVLVDESGFKQTFTIFFNTLIVVTFCYLSMLSLFLQTLVIAFPEILLLVLATSLYLGRWTGLRISEFYRFRNLIFSRGQS